MKELFKAVDGLPFWLKVVLCIPVLDIFWAVYRIIKGAAEKDVLMLVIGIVWVVGGCTVTWIIDLVTTIFNKKPILT